MKILTKLTLPIALSACIVAFAACGGDGKSQGGGTTQEGGEAPTITLTENTDFSALASEVVDEAGWRAAFSNDSYGTYKIKVIEQYAEPEISYVYTQKTSTEIKRYVYSVDGTNANYYGKDNENLYLYQNVDGVWEKQVMPFAGITEDIVNNAMWIVKYIMACPDFSEYFGQFEYDEDTGAYSYRDNSKQTGLSANSIFENWDVNYYLAKVKIINGKLAYLQVQMHDPNPITDIYFYDFDNTEVTYPETN